MLFDFGWFRYFFCRLNRCWGSFCRKDRKRTCRSVWIQVSVIRISSVFKVQRNGQTPVNSRQKDGKGKSSSNEPYKHYWQVFLRLIYPEELELGEFTAGSVLRLHGSLKHTMSRNIETAHNRFFIVRWMTKPAKTIWYEISHRLRIITSTSIIQSNPAKKKQLKVDTRSACVCRELAGSMDCRRKINIRLLTAELVGSPLLTTLTVTSFSG